MKLLLLKKNKKTKNKKSPPQDSQKKLTHTGSLHVCTYKHSCMCIRHQPPSTSQNPIIWPDYCLNLSKIIQLKSWLTYLYSIFRCRNIWSSLRLQIRKKRLPNSSLYLKRSLWLLDSIFPKLLDLCPTSCTNWFQHRRCWPLCFCPCHRTCWPHKAWRCWYVHILLLLNRNCITLWHSLHFPVMAYSLYRFFHSLPSLSCHCPSFYL